MQDIKKEVCRGLTRALRNSPLAHEIDPKAFFMMLLTNFTTLYRMGTFDLGALWDALTASRDPHRYYGLFVQFEEILRRLEIPVKQAPAVVQLEPKVRDEEVQAAGGFRDISHIVGLSQEDLSLEVDALSDADLQWQGQGPAVPIDDLQMEPAPVSSAAAEPLPLAPEALQPLPPEAPLPLATGDLQPVPAGVSEELRRGVTQAFVESMKFAPVAKRIEPAQLAFQVDTNINQLCDGATFDFGPVIEGLRQMPDFHDSEIYYGLVQFQEAIKGLGLQLAPLDLDIDGPTAQRLIADGDAARVEARRGPVTGGVGAAAPESRTNHTPQRASTTSSGKAAKEAELERLGLGKENSKRFKYIRIIGLVVAALVIGVVAFVLRPNRPLDASEFQAVFPIKSAALRDGYFSGVIDDSQWWGLTKEVRQQKFDALQAKLKEEGYVTNCQIRDGQGRLVITSLGGGRLVATKFFMVGTKEGEVPQSERRAPSNAPALPSKKTP